MRLLKTSKVIKGAIPLEIEILITDTSSQNEGIRPVNDKRFVQFEAVCKPENVEQTMVILRNEMVQECLKWERHYQRISDALALG